jgi:hypothetical protein
MSARMVISLPRMAGCRLETTLSTVSWSGVSGGLRCRSRGTGEPDSTLTSRDWLLRCDADAHVGNHANRKGAIPQQFRPLYDKLVAVRNHLEKLSITHSWALREADLYDYNRTLDKADDMRVDGNWLDDEGKPADLYVQRVRIGSGLLTHFTTSISSVC